VALQRADVEARTWRERAAAATAAARAAEISAGAHAADAQASAAGAVRRDAGSAASAEMDAARAQVTAGLRCLAVTGVRC